MTPGRGTERRNGKLHPSIIQFTHLEIEHIKGSTNTVLQLMMGLRLNVEFHEARNCQKYWNH